MQFKDIIYEVKSDYAHVTINRPKVLNAFTPVTLQELKTALDSAEKDKNVGVIVLYILTVVILLKIDVSALFIFSNNFECLNTPVKFCKVLTL